MSQATDVVQSAAKFLQTPAKPERKLEEKIRFLIYEKKLTQFQLIAALKQAKLYSIETIEPILTMCYFEQNQKKNSKRNAKRSSKQKHRQTAQSGIASPMHPSLPPPQPSFSWWSTLTNIGIGAASFVASYTVSTTASQKLVKRSEDRTTAKLDTVKTEIKEQADLDRERQHRDLMEVVNLLKTQVQCVQQNLGVLKQSIDVIQTQMKYNSMNMGNNMDVAHASSVINRNIRSSTADDGSVISSNISIQQESKPNLGVIGNLLAQNDDGLDWLNSDIVTSNINEEEKGKKESLTHHMDEHKATAMDSDAMDEDKLSVTDKSVTDSGDDESEVIYHPDYKDMIKTLPTDIIEIKQQLTDLLRMWQRMVSNTNEELTVAKIKAGFNALNFYINKILKKPFIEQTRKINTYNKQYKERLSTLPRIETLLTLIGYEKDNVFWSLPLLYKQNTTEKEEGKNDEQSKKLHDKQIEFLGAFKEVLSNLFNIDGSLPFDLSESIMNIKKEREDKQKAKEKEKTKANMDKTQAIEEAPIVTHDTSTIITNDPQGIVTDAAAKQYSLKEVSALVAEGKKPDDVRVIDDMPPDPNAKPSESKMAQPQKPFQMDVISNVNETKSKDEDNSEPMTWFEKYEAQQKNNTQIESANIDNMDTNVDKDAHDDKDANEKEEAVNKDGNEVNELEHQQNEQ